MKAQAIDTSKDRAFFAANPDRLAYVREPHAREWLSFLASGGRIGELQRLVVVVVSVAPGVRSRIPLAVDKTADTLSERHACQLLRSLPKSSRSRLARIIKRLRLAVPGAGID